MLLDVIQVHDATVIAIRVLSSEWIGSYPEVVRLCLIAAWCNALGVDAGSGSPLCGMMSVSSSSSSLLAARQEIYIDVKARSAGVLLSSGDYITEYYCTVIDSCHNDFGIYKSSFNGLLVLPPAGTGDVYTTTGYRPYQVNVNAACLYDAFRILE